MNTKSILCGVFLAGAGACAPMPEGHEGDVTALEQEVQLTMPGAVVDHHSSIGTGSAHMLHWRNGLYKTCGLTFVSPHYAITAAHCVDEFEVDNNRTVDASDETINIVYEIDVDEAFDRISNGEWGVLGALFNHTVVTGTWPNYLQAPFSPTYGYNVPDYSISSCRVVRRCGGRFSPKNCPSEVAQVSTSNNVDIALVHCPDRDLRSFTRVANDDIALGSEVEVHWHHELANLAKTRSDTNGPAGNYEHYQLWDDKNLSENYHYTKWHQAFPFVSKHGPTGEHYKVVDGRTHRDSALSWTNAFGCHGTSGSGAFKHDGRFLGPISKGVFSTTNEHTLCKYGLEKDYPSLAYQKPTITRALARDSHVRNDN